MLYNGAMDVKGFDDTIRWYDDNAEEYAESANQVQPVQIIEDFLAVLPEDPYVLEAGCGPGRESKIFRNKGIRVVGIDLSEGLIAVARKHNPDVEYIIGDFRNMPFVDGIFDGVWSHASLVHFEQIQDVEDSLAEFYRVLKQGGKLFVKTKARIGENETEVVADTLSNHDRFFRYYTIEQLTNLLEKAGFTIHSASLHPDDHGRREVSWIHMNAEKV